MYVCMYVREKICVRERESVCVWVCMYVSNVCMYKHTQHAKSDNHGHASIHVYLWYVYMYTHLVATRAYSIHHSDIVWDAKWLIFVGKPIDKNSSRQSIRFLETSWKRRKYCGMHVCMYVCMYVCVRVCM